MLSLDKDLPENVEPAAVTATLTDDLLTHNTIGQSRQMSQDTGRSMFVVFHERPPCKHESAM
jgi:hypothetical protein